MSAELIKQLAERRQNIWNETKALLDGASNENRDLTGEEETRYQAMAADLTALRARIDQIEDTATQNRAAEEALTRMLGAPSQTDPPGGGGLEAQFRALASGETRAVHVDARSMGEAWRALSVGTPTAGGNTVPTEFQRRLVEHLVETSGLMQLGPTVLNTASGEPLEIPITTSHGAGGRIGEAGDLASVSTDPTYGKRLLNAFKYVQFITLSRELVEDTAVDLLGYIARVTGRNIGLAFGAEVITGDGDNKPQGVAPLATAGKTGAAAVAGQFTADDLIDLMFSVISPYRSSPSAGWLVRDATLASIRKLKDGAQRYIFEPGLGIAAPDTVLGKPIKTDMNVAAVGVGAKSVLFGDWAAYYLRFAGGVRFERSDEFRFQNDQIAFRCIIRGDGELVDQTGAIKAFVGGAVS